MDNFLWKKHNKMSLFQFFIKNGRRSIGLVSNQIIVLKVVHLSFSYFFIYYSKNLFEPQKLIVYLYVHIIYNNRGHLTDLLCYFFVAETTTFREWVHYRYGTYSEVGFESDPLYPGYYQSGPLEKASVGCHNLTLEGATVAQAAAFSRDQESQTQQMVDASILRNKVRN